MKLPETYFENLSSERFRAYLKVLPNMRQETSTGITMIIFTLLALSIFGFFAIEPTLTTIFGLNKQLSDSELLKEQLTTKITNLSSLQQQYTTFSSDLPVLLDAIPASPQVTMLSGQVAALVQQSGLTLITYRVSQVQLSQLQVPPNGDSSYTFFIQAQGDYQAVNKFLTSLIRFDRITTIDSISLNKDPNIDTLDLAVEAKTYFK